MLKIWLETENGKVMVENFIDMSLLDAIDFYIEKYSIPVRLHRFICWERLF